MLTRRNFLAGACCLLHAGPAAAAGRKERSFICGATHAPPLGWIGPSGIPLAGASFNDQQAWRVEDGVTPKGDVITLDVHSMNGPKSDHRKVERIASEWTDKALGERVRFRFGRPRAASQIRILFDPNKGYSSKVGRDNLGVPKTSPPCISPTRNTGPSCTSSATSSACGTSTTIRHRASSGTSRSSTAS